MSNHEDFQALEATITAIPAEEVSIPTIPVDIFNQEAENLYHWATVDKDALVARGLDPVVIDTLPTGAGACRQAQALWFKERYAKQEAEKEWQVKSPEAYQLRDELLAEYEFAFYDQPALMSRVDEAKNGSGHEDMIQDLNDLALLGKENNDLLTATNFDVTQLDRAATLSDEMADLLARVNGEKADDSAAKLLRDKAYTYLKKQVDEVKRYGKFVFRNNDERLTGYRSHYRTEHRKH